MGGAPGEASRLYSVSSRWISYICTGNGHPFSGGERQRIALARILLQDAPIVVLDEPTVGLDPKTEKELLSTMFQVLDGKTVLWITHHWQEPKRPTGFCFRQREACNGREPSAALETIRAIQDFIVWMRLSAGFLVENAKHSFKL
ncbi:ATP-binding cassette domain-containing protein [Bacillus licheniformis]|nr:ATP-binding cassette domain-containing protein [Bacillus licheniformis]